MLYKRLTINLDPFKSISYIACFKRAIQDMHRSLAKQDTLVKHVILVSFVWKEIPQPWISLTIPHLSLYNTLCLIPFLIKNFANIFKLKPIYKFCVKFTNFRSYFPWLNNIISLPMIQFYFFLWLLDLASGHFPSGSFNKINKPNTKSDLYMDSHSESNNFFCLTTGAFASYILIGKYRCCFVRNLRRCIYTV